MTDDGDEPIPSFDDSTQEAIFWKKRAQDLRELLDEAHQSLSEFEASSKELEEEMDRDLAQSNQHLQRATHDNEKLSQEVQQWKEKYQVFLNNRNKESAETNKELVRLRETAEMYRKKLRDIELDNDDLEMAERMIRSTLEDVEMRYHQQMEKTTLMEQEIIDKLQLEETNQRLKDEIRELGEELSVLREREQQLPGTPSSTKSDEMTLSELSCQTKSRASRPTVPPRTSAAVASESVVSSSPSATARSTTGKTTLRPRASLALRTTLAHSRTTSRDVGSPTLAARQASLAATIRSTAPPPRNPPLSQTRTSTRMARDLHTKIGTLQTKIGTSLQHNSKIPRPSLNLGASISVTAMSTPLRASTATIVPGTGSSSETLRQSHIPLPNSSLRKSIGRPSGRFSLSQAAMPRDTMTPDPNSDDSTSGSRLRMPPRSSTPTLHSARARQDTSIWSSDTLQPGKRGEDANGRPSSVTGVSPFKRATSPLHFLNTDPQAQHCTRPSSRPSMSASARDTFRNGRVRSQHDQGSTASHRPLQRSNTIDQTSIARRAEPTTRTRTSFEGGRPTVTATATSHTLATYPGVSQSVGRGEGEDGLVPFRSEATRSSSTAVSSSLGQSASARPSSVSAFRESKAHRTLHGVGAGSGPPPVAHTGLKRIIAAPPTSVAIAAAAAGPSRATPTSTPTSSASAGTMSVRRGRRGSASTSPSGMSSAPGSHRMSFEQEVDRD